MLEGEGVAIFDVIPLQKKYAGGYQIGGAVGIRFNLERSPTRWHRFWTRVLLGWRWVDGE